MTIEEFIAKQKRRLEAIKSDAPLFKGASSTLAQQVERIFTEGKASDGSSIGQYDNKKPLYVGPRKMPVALPPQGKTGKKEFKNGEPHKTKYFSNYRAFREEQGRPADKVSLDLFGRMKSEYENSLTKIDDNNYETVLRTDESKGKATGNQSRFKKTVFALTKEERELFITVIREEFNLINENA